MNLKFTFGRRLWLLALVFLIGLVVAVMVQLGLSLTAMRAEAVLRISQVLSQLLMFMVPAVVVAMMCTRLPARLLTADSLPDGKSLLMALTLTLVSLPAMNCLVEWFELLPWPASVVASEAQNQQAIEMLIGGHSAMNLILGVCIIGILPGVCEELFFRGALLGLLRSKPMNLHLAIWVTAVIFSLLHGQPIGFVPRVLLGAAFGYVMVWTGSIWTAVCCHVLNNSTVTYMQWAGIDDHCMGLSTPALSAVSAVLTIAGLWWLWRHSKFISRGI